MNCPCKTAPQDLYFYYCKITFFPASESGGLFFSNPCKHWSDCHAAEANGIEQALFLFNISSYPATPLLPGAFLLDEGQELGLAMMERLAALGKKEGFRLLGCECQNTNVPAIDFYRRAGLELDSLDLSFYPESAGEIAFFMKRRL